MIPRAIAEPTVVRYLILLAAVAIIFRLLAFGAELGEQERTLEPRPSIVVGSPGGEILSPLPSECILDDELPICVEPSGTLPP